MCSLHTKNSFRSCFIKFGTRRRFIGAAFQLRFTLGKDQENSEGFELNETHEHLAYAGDDNPLDKHKHMIKTKLLLLLLLVSKCCYKNKVKL
jgi:hypothetical protein